MNPGTVIKLWCVWAMLMTGCAPLLFAAHEPEVTCETCTTDAECEALCDPLCPGAVYCRGACVATEEECP